MEDLNHTAIPYIADLLFLDYDLLKPNLILTQTGYKICEKFTRRFMKQKIPLSLLFCLSYKTAEWV